MPTGHYTRAKKDPETELRKRFKINRRNGCWDWTGCKQTQGYGTIKLNGVLWLGSRLSWTLFRGRVPSGMNVCHKCDRPGCINPAHLFLGTQKDNMQDAWKKGRLRPCPWTVEQRAKRGTASRKWWSEASDEQKARIHCAPKGVHGKFQKVVT